jgi:16S rRNA (uracil1498-N3)-methyltransferase
VAGSLALERAEAIVREACEQSERLWLPKLALDQELAAELDRGPAIEARCRGELRLLATTRHANLEALQQVLASTGPDSAAAPSRVRLAIGPEGGWSAAEEQLALSRGWQPVSLGPTILRTSTAAVAAAAQLTAWRAGWAG